MKAKFVGGPYHGKTKDVNLDRRGSLLVNQTFPRNMNPFFAPDGGVPDLIQYKTHTYEIRMMGITIDGIYYKAPAMHPDGSIFLVHERYKNV